MGRVNEETTKSGSFSSKRMRALFIVREIFSSTTVTGKLHYASTQEPPDSADERQLEADFFNTRVHVDVKIPRLKTKENQLLDQSDITLLYQTIVVRIRWLKRLKCQVYCWHGLKH